MIESEIPAVNIVYISVMIIINTIAGNLVFIYPHIGSQIRMIIINAAVDNADNNI